MRIVWPLFETVIQTNFPNDHNIRALTASNLIWSNNIRLFADDASLFAIICDDIDVIQQTLPITKDLDTMKIGPTHGL